MGLADCLSKHEGCRKGFKRFRVSCEKKKNVKPIWETLKGNITV
jgi:hypothetical protein